MLYWIDRYLRCQMLLAQQNITGPCLSQHKPLCSPCCCYPFIISYCKSSPVRLPLPDTLGWSHSFLVSNYPMHFSKFKYLVDLQYHSSFCCVHESVIHIHTFTLFYILFHIGNFPYRAAVPNFLGPGTGFTEDYFYTDRAWECFQDDFGTVGFALLWDSNAVIDLTGGRVQAVMRAMEGGYKYRWSFTCHLLLYSPVPTRLLVHGLGVGNPWYRVLSRVPVLWSRSLLVIYLYIVVCICQTQSPSLSLPLSPLTAISLFLKSVTPFLFYK